MLNVHLIHGYNFSVYPVFALTSENFSWIRSWEEVTWNASRRMGGWY